MCDPMDALWFSQKPLKSHYPPLFYLLTTNQGSSRCSHDCLFVRWICLITANARLKECFLFDIMLCLSMGENLSLLCSMYCSFEVKG